MSRASAPALFCVTGLFPSLFWETWGNFIEWWETTSSLCMGSYITQSLLWQVQQFQIGLWFSLFTIGLIEVHIVCDRLRKNVFNFTYPLHMPTYQSVWTRKCLIKQKLYTNWNKFIPSWLLVVQTSSTTLASTWGEYLILVSLNIKGNSFRVDYPLSSFFLTQIMISPVADNSLKVIKKYFSRQSAPTTVNNSLCIVSLPAMSQGWLLYGTLATKDFWTEPAILHEQQQKGSG